jgi:single-stranded DNA-binding protein
MTTHALVSGSIFRAAEQRTSKAGKAYVIATVKVKSGEELQWWRVTAFSESVQAELMRLGEGDACSLQGNFKVEIYRPEDGEPKLSLSIVADRVLALSQPKEHKPAAPEPPRVERSRQGHRGETWAPGAGPNDDFPF